MDKKSMVSIAKFLKGSARVSLRNITFSCTCFKKLCLGLCQLVTKSIRELARYSPVPVVGEAACAQKGASFYNSLFKNNVNEILDPYVTTKKNGTGLGLSIVNKIINDHNGEINFVSIPSGAKIEIIFN